MTKKTFERAAQIVREAPVSERYALCAAFVRLFVAAPRFDAERFRSACGLLGRGQLAGPHWVDACGHTRPLDRYLGTVLSEGEPVDAYVYQDNAAIAPPDMHVCLRYGPGPSDYMSPGPVRHFVDNCRAGNAPREYQAALALVLAWRDR